jgi:shikimate dehydrogenase
MCPETYALGLTGWPLTYSLSPAIQNAALTSLHLQGEYRLYPAPPMPAGRQALLDLIARLRSGELTGLNVTIPHKQAILTWLDELTPLAKAVGAVNTLYCRGSRLFGDNTDVAGFLADLKREAPYLPLSHKQAPSAKAHALILGAGGAARAVACALAGVGWRVTIVARRIDQAEKLVEDLCSSMKDGRFTAISMAAWIGQYASGYNLVSGHDQKGEPGRIDEPTMAARLDLVVNATPAGMVSHEHENAWPDELPLPPGAFIYDLVYVPRVTALIRKARAAGNPAANGSGMLIEQAAAAFEIWTGRTAPRRAMRQAITDNSTAMSEKHI